MDEVRAGRAKTGRALLIVSLVRPTQVRPVIDRERQALARIFDAYAQPRDRMARRGMIDLVRDFGIIPSLVPPTTCGGSTITSRLSAVRCVMSRDVICLSCTTHNVRRKYAYQPAARGEVRDVT